MNINGFWLRLISLALIGLLVTSCGSSSSDDPLLCMNCKDTYLTTSQFTGDLITEEGGALANGILAADSLCMNDANYPGTGTYKALIVDGVNRIASVTANTGDGQVDWVLSANTAYYRSDGTTYIMTTDANGLFVFGTLDNSFGPVFDYIWTGLNADWTTSSSLCTNVTSWATSSAVVNGMLGNSSFTTSVAIAAAPPVECSASIVNLLCVEQ